MAVNIPFFYGENLQDVNGELILTEDTSRHIVQVLRMVAGENIRLTDGKGNLLTCTIVEAHKKHAAVQIESTEFFPPPLKQNTIAVSLVKNTARLEWLLEKLTETGIAHIIPLICEHTEKHRTRTGRLQAILVSAMLQSQQVWLPKLQEPQGFSKVVEIPGNEKYIAHCIKESERTSFMGAGRFEQAIIMIGPEGDFSAREIESALKRDFIPVTLGPTRLRTETAAMAAAVIMQCS